MWRQVQSTRNRYFHSAFHWSDGWLWRLQKITIFIINHRNYLGIRALESYLQHLPLNWTPHTNIKMPAVYGCRKTLKTCTYYLMVYSNFLDLDSRVPSFLRQCAWLSVPLWIEPVSVFCTIKSDPVSNYLWMNTIIIPCHVDVCASTPAVWIYPLCWPLTFWSDGYLIECRRAPPPLCFPPLTITHPPWPLNLLGERWDTPTTYQSSYSMLRYRCATYYLILYV